jgi:5-methylcytosine-specific restriction endonuclease McrA
MIAIEPLKLKVGFTYDLCINLIEDHNLKAKFVSDKAEIVQLENNYITEFSADNQHKLQYCKRGDNTQKITTNLTKGDLTNLYSSYFLDKNKDARKYYDKIMSLAPFSKCPFCRISDVETLDHVAPKAYYPAFSVFHRNLYPCCASCNKRMGSGIFDSNKISIHPYSFDARITSDIWLYAKIKRKRPISLEFYVKPPNNWPDDLKEKVKNYFSETKLAEKFAVNSAAEVVQVSDQIIMFKDKMDAKEYIERLYASENEDRKNTMKHAIYHALMNSIWFCTTGYDYKKINQPILAAPAS